ncbi:DMT family transporter [Zoogloea dura]|uniref:DMT family transporter n=1 Tax=Zoogloea dura TaxID=2728840 RepID=A0A848G2K1_9RHOO|nr:DMT family transporter [Zoogloea dura]NML25330.1 DMT family transporter [Zoogloea dura]
MDRSRALGASLVALSAASFGAMAIFARLALAEGVDVPTMLFLRFAVAGGLLAVFMAVSGRPWPVGRNQRVLILMGAVGYVGQSFCFFSALGHASAGLVALLLYLYPFIVTVLGVLFLGERLTRLRLGAVLAALSGTALILGSGIDGSPLGIGFGLAAALIYSVYILVGGKVLREEDPLAAAAVVMLAAAAVFGVQMLLQVPAPPTTPTAWAAVIAIALVSTIVAMVGFFAGLRRLGAADAATLSTLEPVVTFVLAALVLGLAAVAALARGKRPAS